MHGVEFSEADLALGRSRLVRDTTEKISGGAEPCQLTGYPSAEAHRFQIERRLLDAPIGTPHELVQDSVSVEDDHARQFVTPPEAMSAENQIGRSPSAQL